MITFKKRSAGLRLAEHNNREYWLSANYQLNGSIEITLTRVVAGVRTRFAPWTQLSPASDETTARALILEQDALSLRL